MATMLSPNHNPALNQLNRRRLAPDSPLRFERRIYGVSLFQLSAATKGVVSTRKLSLAERRLRPLTAVEETARGAALEDLKGAI